MGLAELKLSGLRQFHGRTPVLDGLTLNVEPGMITVLLGPAGSGKSSLMRIVAGFEAPLAGIVQQPDLLFPHLSVAENVGLPLQLRRTSSAGRSRLVATTLEQLQLGHAASLLPRSLTPAEAQRAVLARAMVFAPRILLLDEPFSAHQAGERASLIASLRRMHALLGTTTTLLATRIGTDALEAADRLAILRQGVVDQYGTPAELFDRPRNLHAAALLGDINRLPGLVDKVDDDVAIVRLDCGPVIEALRGRNLDPGDPCVIGVRPDRVAIAAITAAEMGERAIDATVLEAQIVGEQVRLRLLIGSGTELRVRRPAAAGLRGLAVGAQAAVAWQPHHAACFRLDQPAGTVP
jgi:putative spermidine/putrescine transport system ATP-binding protein